MKCFALFVLVALAAVAMAQEEQWKPEGIRNLGPEVPKPEPPRAPEAEEITRAKRGYLTSGYTYSVPYYNGGYNTHANLYNAPYGYYYQTYPQYRSHYYYY